MVLLPRHPQYDPHSVRWGWSGAVVVLLYWALVDLARAGRAATGRYICDLALKMQQLIDDNIGQPEAATITRPVALRAMAGKDGSSMRRSSLRIAQPNQSTVSSMTFKTSGGGQ